MKRYVALETLFCKVDLSFVERILQEPYHAADSPGRPPRNPLGIFARALNLFMKASEQVKPRKRAHDDRYSHEQPSRHTTIIGLVRRFADEFLCNGTRSGQLLNF